MDNIKLENFEGDQFPDYVTLLHSDCNKIKLTLKRKIGLKPATDSLILVKTLYEKMNLNGCVDHVGEKFDFNELLTNLGVVAEKHVYINWYRFDDIDKMQLCDFIINFDDLWYQGVDDIDVFDETLGWMVSISHYGSILYTSL